MITIQKGTIELTESELNQIVSEVERVKSEVRFTADPMPMSDMSEKQYRELSKLRGRILIEPSGGGLSFAIKVSVGNDTRESRGYKAA